MQLHEYKMGISKKIHVLALHLVDEIQVNDGQVSNRTGYCT